MPTIVGWLVFRSIFIIFGPETQKMWVTNEAFSNFVRLPRFSRLFDHSLADLRFILLSEGTLGDDCYPSVVNTTVACYYLFVLFIGFVI